MSHVYKKPRRPSVSRSSPLPLCFGLAVVSPTTLFTFALVYCFVFFFVRSYFLLVFFPFERSHAIFVQLFQDKEMNHFGIQQNSFAADEEVRGNHAAASYRSETVVCPKPRRLGLLPSTLRWHASHHQEVLDSMAGNEDLDIVILSKGDCVSDQTASSPPFFCGSPPSRASNPLIQDARFRDESHHPISPRKGGCIRANFGNNPAVRIEGFDCLDRDRRACSIPALA